MTCTLRRAVCPGQHLGENDPRTRSSSRPLPRWSKARPATAPWFDAKWSGTPRHCGPQAKDLAKSSSYQRVQKGRSAQILALVFRRGHRLPTPQRLRVHGPTQACAVRRTMRASGSIAQCTLCKSKLSIRLSSANSLVSDNSAPKAVGFRVETGLLKRVDCIPNQTLQSFDLRLTLSNCRIMAGPLPNQRPSRPMLIQQAGHVIFAASNVTFPLPLGSLHISKTVDGSTAQKLRAKVSATSNGRWILPCRSTNDAGDSGIASMPRRALNRSSTSGSTVMDPL